MVVMIMIRMQKQIAVSDCDDADDPYDYCILKGGGSKGGK